MTLKELEQTVAQLTLEDLARFREWFMEFDSGRWDEQISDDVSGGRLDALGDAAIADDHGGLTKPL